jgi:hypothetical protein
VLTIATTTSSPGSFSNFSLHQFGYSRGSRLTASLIKRDYEVRIQLGEIMHTFTAPDIAVLTASLKALTKVACSTAYQGFQHQGEQEPLEGIHTYCGGGGTTDGIRVCATWGGVYTAVVKTALVFRANMCDANQ